MRDCRERQLRCARRGGRAEGSLSSGPQKAGGTLSLLRSLTLVMAVLSSGSFSHFTYEKIEAVVDEVGGYIIVFSKPKIFI